MGKSKDLATLKDSGLTVSNGGLSVSGASGDILNVSSTTGSEFAMRVDGNEVSFKADADNDDNDSVMTFDLDGSEKMRLTDTGRLGVGTTNPVHDLQIHKATASSQARIQMTTNESGATNSDGYAVAMESGNRVYHWLYENAPMQFATNNTLNMVINADGSVTKPNQPSFYAYPSASFNTPVSSWTTVTFNTVGWDVGSNYNSSNYRFTAPVAGKYLIAWKLQLENSNEPTWIYAYPIVNGSRTTQRSKGVSFSDFKVSPTYHTESGAWIMNLAANDYVTFDIHTNGASKHFKAESHWSGILLG